MTLSLRRVELANIRSHKHIIFTPEAEGVTAISGANGTGKSTLVDSIAWALFGTKPNGISKGVSIFRVGAEFPEDKSYARIDFNLDGQLYRVERRRTSKGGAVECEVFQSTDGSVGEAWKNLAGPSVSHGEAFLRKLLAMDERGFLAAILIQQKQVDQLISAAPRERGAVIEKLTGISSLTRGLVEARQEYNLLRKAVTFSDGDEGELEALEKELEEKRETLTEQKVTFQDLKSDVGRLSAHGVELKTKLHEEEERTETATARRERIVELTTSLRHLEEELAKATQRKEQAKKSVSQLAPGDTLQAVDKSLQEMREAVSILTSQILLRENKRQDNSQALATIEELMGQAGTPTAAEVEEQLSAVQKKLTGGEAEVEKTRLKLTELRVRRDSLTEAISVLAERDGSCPTCLQKVTQVEMVVNGLAADREKVGASIERGEARLEKMSQALEALTQTLSSHRALSEALDRKAAMESEENELIAQITTLRSEERGLRGELVGLEKRYSVVKAEESLREEYQAALTSAQQLSTQVETSRGELKELETVKGAKILSPAALSKLRKEFDSHRTTFMQKNNEFTELKGALSVLAERISHLEEKVEKSKASVAKHQELLKSVEVAHNSTLLLEEFRELRIKHSVPLIETYASDFLNRFTEGKFTRLRINQKFETSVYLADGTERSIGLLSGGELSAAAMALRLAVARALGGGSEQNIIIMDEVLVSQDPSRAETILSTVKEICRGQVILIAHNDSINAFADKVVELT